MESISPLDRRVDVENSSKNIDVSLCYYVDCEIECDLYYVECNAVLVLTANCRMLTNFCLPDSAVRLILIVLSYK